MDLRRGDLVGRAYRRVVPRGLRHHIEFVDGQVWLGELTPYPGIGLVRYEPRAFDDWLGSLWTLPQI